MSVTRNNFTVADHVKGHENKEEPRHYLAKSFNNRSLAAEAVSQWTKI
jgi:hypothetical protein